MISSAWHFKSAVSDKAVDFRIYTKNEIKLRIFPDTAVGFHVVKT